MKMYAIYHKKTGELKGIVPSTEDVHSFITVFLLGLAGSYEVKEVNFILE